MPFVSAIRCTVARQPASLPLAVCRPAIRTRLLSATGLAWVSGLTLMTGLGLVANQALAQEGGGVSYTLGIDQRLDARTNPGLSIPEDDTEITSRTRLTFGAATETATQRLALIGAGTLVAGKATSTGLVSPSAEVSYGLEGASSRLDLSAFVRENDVDTLDLINDPLLTSVSGTGTQRRTGATGTLAFGTDAPFGGSLSLGVTDTDYTDTTDPDLVDNRRSTARLALRFDLSQVTTATAALSASRLKEVGSAPSNSETLSLGLARALPNGAITADATVSRVTGGTRNSLVFGRSLDLPDGSLSARLGVSSTTAGDSKAIGGLDWNRDLAQGSLYLGISHEVTGNERDEETEVSRLRLGIEQALSESVGLTADMNVQDSRETLSNTSVQTTDLSAAMRYALTADWGLSLGATHRIRKETGVGTARSSGVFLSVGRSFEFRP